MSLFIKYDLKSFVAIFRPSIILAIVIMFANKVLQSNIIKGMIELWIFFIGENLSSPYSCFKHNT